MIVFLTVLVMLIVGYAQCREGLLTAAATLLNIILAGLLTFSLWEPLADEADSLLTGSFLAGYEDVLVLTVLFTTFLALLRMATNKIVPQQTDFPGYVQQIGGGAFGLAAGYLLAGFLVCALQTLPWHENFLGFKPRAEGETGLRRILPPDRVWLAMMRYAGAHGLAWTADTEHAVSSYDRSLTFDAGGTFELRYLRYRRYGDTREPLQYQGELNRELRKDKTPLNFP